MRKRGWKIKKLSMEIKAFLFVLILWIRERDVGFRKKFRKRRLGYQKEWKIVHIQLLYRP